MNSDQPRTISNESSLVTECDETELQRIRDKLGMVFQEGALFDSLTVYENVAYHLQERDMPEKNVEEEVLSLLKFVKLENEMDKLPSELIEEGRAIQRLGGREQYANIEDPKTAPNILNHPKSPMP
jgi:ABC-type transporter Mla maintaining outer membrane lipid asymmetry ATPase subunit MlaF